MCYSEVIDKMTAFEDKIEDILIAIENEAFDDYINNYLRMQREDYNNKAYEKGHF